MCKDLPSKNLRQQSIPHWSTKTLNRLIFRPNEACFLSICRGIAGLSFSFQTITFQIGKYITERGSRGNVLDPDWETRSEVRLLAQGASSDDWPRGPVGVTCPPLCPISTIITGPVLQTKAVEKALVLEVGKSGGNLESACEARPQLRPPSSIFADFET